MQRYNCEPLMFEFFCELYPVVSVVSHIFAGVRKVDDRDLTTDYPSLLVDFSTLLTPCLSLSLSLPLPHTLALCHGSLPGDVRE